MTPVCVASLSSNTTKESGSLRLLLKVEARHRQQDNCKKTRDEMGEGRKKGQRKASREVRCMPVQIRNPSQVARRRKKKEEERERA
mmetsp:Transcript_3088/g.6304  ORF Transcript_3088/g.6304 Transcript_3088/m.6304 type:complete len:86 (+) Transcript_3088:1284-1541(+)